MHVLVVVASRHHATYEIGRRIATTLTAAGLTADVRRPEEVHDLAGCDAVVLGSAVYAGQWLPSARSFAERLSAGLATRAVWLFSSGPVADAPGTSAVPAGVSPILARLRPRGHRVLAGRLDPDGLRLGEQVALGGVATSAGDARDWAAVDAWAREIAAALDRERRASAIA